MPAPIPPGYTRGPILFVGAPTATPQDDSLYQWFWDEAGSFGARILLVVIGIPMPDAFGALHAHLQEWECDRLATLHLADRMAARDPAHVTQVEQATAIALFGHSARVIAPIVGGTPLAQSIRRANARGKLVAGFGSAAAFLCQHMLFAVEESLPATLQEVVTFAPGLGLLNRLVIDTPNDAPSHPTTDSPGNAPTSLALRLSAAVGHNPFLVGVGLAPGSAATLYPDETLQALGAPGVTLVEGTEVTAVDLAGPPVIANVQGARAHHLQQGDGFNLDDRRLRRGDDIDLPPTSPPRTTY